MPVEFWQEVVNRISAEAPDTLLLAEAFWLMEGYFVRTLGMHRVYNSAFMNMLRNEDNASYRQLMKNTLEFDPEILRRYVNFMNNPDERTAIDQFGDGDKYFGICTLMVTMPGLPMFGHGQIEGYAEKYGMEFKKPLWDESENQYLVDRHYRQIFPLLHHRALFAGVENFRFYDFLTGQGVDENVFAYSNHMGNEYALVVYNNKFSTTGGNIHFSTGISTRIVKNKRKIVSTDIASALNIKKTKGEFTIMQDIISTQEFIFETHSLVTDGLHLELSAYKTFVFMHIRQVADDAALSYSNIFHYLNGRGVPSIEDAMKELLLAPVRRPFQEIFNHGFLKYILDHRLTAEKLQIPAKLNSEIQAKNG